MQTEAKKRMFRNNPTALQRINEQKDARLHLIDVQHQRAVDKAEAIKNATFYKLEAQQKRVEIRADLSKKQMGK